jgi:uroporphyrin-III C-methyltransferase
LAGLLQADVIVHDALVDARVLALASSDARLEFAGKRGGRPSAIQADISRRLVDLARSGARVLRLKGGDPYMFGRAGEETLALATAGVPFRVISGVTAALAALAAASIPATMRGVNRSIIFTTGQSADARDGQDWAALARTGQPIVIYMALHNLDAIAEALMHGGLPPETPAAVIVSAARSEQDVLVSTLARIAADAQAQRLEPPAIAVIGQVVAQLYHFGPAFRLRQDHCDARPAGGVSASRHQSTRRQSRAGLHRHGVPCRRDRCARHQSR